MIKYICILMTIINILTSLTLSAFADTIIIENDLGNNVRIIKEGNDIYIIDKDIKVIEDRTYHFVDPYTLKEVYFTDDDATDDKDRDIFIVTDELAVEDQKLLKISNPFDPSPLIIPVRYNTQVELTIRNYTNKEIEFKIPVLDVYEDIPKKSREVVEINFIHPPAKEISYVVDEPGGSYRVGRFIVIDYPEKGIGDTFMDTTMVLTPVPILDKIIDNEDRCPRPHKKPFALPERIPDRPPEMRPSRGCY